jgi:cytochrome c oxidase assembly protein subunit 15
MMRRSQWFFPISLTALLLAGLVVVLGAYTRLTDAGLGCPDWPGCYGRMIVPNDVDAAAALFPERPLEHGKAWTEMVHRYGAGLLGLLILVLAASAWRHRRVPGQQVKLPLILLGLVIFQSALGMWTVTWLLKPAVVSAHLLGGLATLALLFWLVLRQLFHGPSLYGRSPSLLPWALAALSVLVLQIFLGGWTSANYAAAVCTEFPACRGGEWWPEADFSEAFVLWRGLGESYEGGVLDGAARTAIQLSHRVGAVIALVVIGAVALRALLAPDRRGRMIGTAIGVLLCLQIGLGITMVLTALPLGLAVAHSATAALLLLAVVALLHHAALSRR